MAPTRCDLVLLSWNHLECTHPCVESIFAHTNIPTRLIIVDQGSQEETKVYLQSLVSIPSLVVEIIWNRSNVGYPKGMNQGLARATAPYVCFLNNDILLPPGWLEELIAVAESDPSIGSVNPASNNFSIVPPASTHWLEYAKARSALHGRWTEANYGEGSCLLVKKKILDSIGGFDEETYEQIYFEDADLGRRIQAAGYRCVMAEGTYMWHKGGQTMSQRPERLRLFQENERRFIQRWGKGQRILYAVETNSADRLKQMGEQARAHANRSSNIWIFLPRNPLSNGLPRHLNIRIVPFPKWLLPWAALWKAFTKKKKFEVIVSDIGWLRLTLRLGQLIHRAQIRALEQ